MAKTFQELLAQINKNEEPVSSRMSYSDAMLKASDILEKAYNTKSGNEGPSYDGELGIAEYSGVKRATGEDVKTWVIKNNGKQLLSFIQLKSGKCVIDIDPDGDSSDTEYDLEDDDANSIKGIYTSLMSDSKRCSKKSEFRDFASKMADSVTNPELRSMLKDIIGVPASDEFEQKLAKQIGNVLSNIDKYKFAWDEYVMIAYDKSTNKPIITLSLTPDGGATGCIGNVGPSNPNRILGEEGTATVKHLVTKLKESQYNCMEDMHPMHSILKNSSSMKELFKEMLTGSSIL